MRMSFRNSTLKTETQLLIGAQRYDVTMKPSTELVTHAASRVVNDDEELFISHPKAVLLEPEIVGMLHVA